MALSLGVLSLRGFLRRFGLKRKMKIRALSWAMLVLWGVGASSMVAQSTVAERYLFQAVNEERQKAGVPLLHWDEALYRAADQHAQVMAEHRSISHQYAGEPDLAERGHMAAAHFSTIAENVAMAPTAVRIHDAWMNSTHHRENILDPRLDAVAIRVLQSDGELYAVEDFSRTVESLSLGQQEQAVAALIAAQSPGLELRQGSSEARQTCTTETGYGGSRRPALVMRFSATELNRLPETLVKRLAKGGVREAAVGACSDTATGSFSAYKVAVLLYP